MVSLPHKVLIQSVSRIVSLGLHLKWEQMFACFLIIILPGLEALSLTPAADLAVQVWNLVQLDAMIKDPTSGYGQGAGMLFQGNICPSIQNILINSRLFSGGRH